MVVESAKFGFIVGDNMRVSGGVGVNIEMMEVASQRVVNKERILGDFADLGEVF